MSYRRRSYSRAPVRAYGRGRRVMGRRVGARAYRRVMPRMRALSRFPAGLSGGRGATELKSIDSKLVSPPISSAGNVHIAQVVYASPLNGAAFYQRIGTRTRGKSLEIRGKIAQTNTNTAAVNSSFARVIILYDRQANGALPTIADILTDYAYDGSTESNAFSGLNMNNRDRFLILRDRKIHLPAVGPLGIPPVNTTPAAVIVRETLTTDQSSSFVVNEFIKLKGLETHYKASTTGGIGDISTGSFLLFLISSGDLGYPAAYSMNYSARFKFFD